jgi:hypothetical protein
MCNIKGVNMILVQFFIINITFLKYMDIPQEII